MTPNLDQFLKETEERCEKATEGPWEYSVDPHGSWVGTPARCITIHEKPKEEKSIIQAMFFTHESQLDNSNFVTHCRTDLPLALKALRIAVEALEYSKLAGSSEADKALAEIEKMVKE